MELRQIAPTSLKPIEKKRVAIYARVSSDKDAAENSLMMQMYYFQQLIKNKPNWKYVGCYMDDGVSGTKDDRKGFQKLMEAVRAGEIDIIITKSITRFARNTVLLLDTIRELKSRGVDLIFENDHVSLNSVQGELLISLLASHAEEQSRSASNNKRWQIRRDFENGRPTFFRMYGYEWTNGQLKIVPEEAKIVRRIFSMYLDGKGTTIIAKQLNREGVPSRITKWHPVTIRDILRNEKYVGDLLLQKHYVPDFRTKKEVRNKGQWRQYLVHDAHEAIIDRNTFERVQKEIEKRQTKYGNSNQPVGDRLFAGLITCEHCKASFMRKMNPSSKSRYPVWKCRNAIVLGKDVCSAKQIRESILIDKTREALELEPGTELTRELIDKHITAIESAAVGRLRFVLSNGEIRELTWENPSRSRSWTPGMKEQARQCAKKRWIREEA